jgi:hypothetical protein
LFSCPNLSRQRRIRIGVIAYPQAGATRRRSFSGPAWQGGGRCPQGNQSSHFADATPAFAVQVFSALDRTGASGESEDGSPFL